MGIIGVSHGMSQVKERESIPEVRLWFQEAASVSPN